VCSCAAIQLLWLLQSHPAGLPAVGAAAAALTNRGVGCMRLQCLSRLDYLSSLTCCVSLVCSSGMFAQLYELVNDMNNMNMAL
jgi:hypothetical protein